MCLSFKKIHAHHVIPISEDSSKALDPDNGIPLCKKCHILTHNPNVRFTKKYLEQYLAESMIRYIYYKYIKGDAKW